MSIVQTYTDLHIPHPDEIFIGGTWVRPAGTERITVINANNEEKVAELADVGFGDVDRAVEAARRAFDLGEWSRLSVEDRIAHLRRFVDELKARMPEINDVFAVECGATLSWREGVHTIGAPLMFETAFDTASSTPLSEMRSSSFGPAEVRREPYGVAVAILTYNGPVGYVAIKVFPALLAGNTVVLKMPPEARLVGQLIAEAADSAALPAGILSVLTAGAEASRYLVEHRDVDVVSFTGGTAVGRTILHSTADRLVKTTLELGGKSAGIVADDISLDQLLPAILPGLLPFQGQVCVALTRILVSRRRHDEVVDALASAFSSLSIGDARDPATEFGPVAVPRTRERCEKFIEGAVSDGAVVATGGHRPAHLDRGWFLEPTLLANVTNSMAVAQEEVFGPVFAVIKYDDIDDAVRITNDSPYGLTAAIFTNDRDLSRSVGRRARVGTFTTNSCGGVPGHPFGGYKMSGIGREMGPEGYLEWLQVKAIGSADRVQFMA